MECLKALEMIAKNLNFKREIGIDNEKVMETS